MDNRKITMIVITAISVLLIPLIVMGFLMQIIGRICLVIGAVFMINPISAKNELYDMFYELKNLWRNK